MAQYSMMNIFPVNFGVINLGEESREMNKRIVQEIYNLKEEEKRMLRTGVGVYQTTLGVEKRSSLLSQVNQHIHELLQQYFKDSGVKDLDALRTENCWFNYNNDANAYHVPHLHGHGSTVFSYVYYPSSGILDGKHLSDDQNLDEEFVMDFTHEPKPGSISFMDPAYNVKRQIIPRKMRQLPYYALHASIVPREGILVVFPAYLVHWVTPTHQENFERFSLVGAVNKYD